MLGELVIAGVVAVQERWVGASAGQRVKLLASLLERLKSYRTSVTEIWIGKSAISPCGTTLALLSRLLGSDMKAVASSDDLTIALLRLTCESCGFSWTQHEKDQYGYIRMKAEATDALGSGTVEMEGTVAHLLAFCTDVLMTEKSVEMYCLALRAIHGLVNAGPPELIARFLPGALSKLVRQLSGIRKRNREVAVDSIRATFALIHRALDMPKSAGATAPVPFSQLIQPSSNKRSSNSSDAPTDKANNHASTTVVDSFRVRRTREWIVSVCDRISGLLRTVMLSPDGPAFHRAESVRNALASALGKLLQRHHNNLQDEFASIAFMICANAAADTGESGIGYILRDLDLERRARYVVGIQSQTTKDNANELFLRFKALDGLLKVIPAENLPPLVASLQTEEELVSMLTKHTFLPAPSLDGEMPISYHIREVCRLVGRHGCENLIATPLLGIVEKTGSDQEVAGACYALNHLLLGVLLKHPRRTEFETSSNVRKLIRQIMSSFALSVLRRADDSDHGVLKRLLALDGIEEIAKSFGRLVTREDILLQVLLPVLEQLTQPTSGEVSAKARSVLESISNIVGYESIAELYRRHLNFIVDSSARFLSPRKTADVLREVVEIVGDDALFILSDQIIRESDILPTLSDEMAVVSLERISSILAVARTAPVTAFGPLVPRLRKDVNKSVLEKLDIYSIQVPHKEQEVEEEVQREAPEEGYDEKEKPILHKVAERTLMGAVDVLPRSSMAVRARALRVALLALEVNKIV
uniref:TTI1 N-terminal TPR domain-containing protein n=3 Tax=Rhodosorus marinus TaxID=101924 RepID=A0A7S2ZQW2_9RHOD|mmetsp:Transcript_27164/g.105765  ORF Transcript_27164/g.105765 Transcript_27164/m.105765 type:complete len:760 (+) Transcript_27164:181-2460(+)